jgi:hypothetical protein
MKHSLKITVSKKPKYGGIVSCRSISVREKLLGLLFGKKARLTIIVPGDTVQEMAIQEIKEGEIL